MFKLKTIKLKKIQQVIKKLPRTIGENAFLILLALLSFSLILSALIFYQYGVLAENKQPEEFEKPIIFQETIYQNILKIWQERGEKFEAAEQKQYSDPFKSLTK